MELDFSRHPPIRANGVLLRSLNVLGTLLYKAKFLSSFRRWVDTSDFGLQSWSLKFRLSVHTLLNWFSTIPVGIPIDDPELLSQSFSEPFSLTFYAVRKIQISNSISIASSPTRFNFESENWKKFTKKFLAKINSSSEFSSFFSDWSTSNFWRLQSNAIPNWHQFELTEFNSVNYFPEHFSENNHLHPKQTQPNATIAVTVTNWTGFVTKLSLHSFVCVFEIGTSDDV